MDSDELRRYQRISVVGTSGSGKSTLARRLAESLDLPHYELDALYWRPDWQPTPDEEIRAKVRDITAGERWILDGNYSVTMPYRWQRVQLVVWLDLSFWRTMARVTRRTWRRCRSGEELWPGTGNRESLRKVLFSRDSILLWALTTHHSNRRRYLLHMNSPEYKDITFLRLRNPRAVSDLLNAAALHQPAEPSYNATRQGMV